MLKFAERLQACCNRCQCMDMHRFLGRCRRSHSGRFNRVVPGSPRNPSPGAIHWPRCSRTRSGEPGCPAAGRGRLVNLAGPVGSRCVPPPPTAPHPTPPHPTCPTPAPPPRAAEALRGLAILRLRPRQMPHYALLVGPKCKIGGARARARARPGSGPGPGARAGPGPGPGPGAGAGAGPGAGQGRAGRGGAGRGGAGRGEAGRGGARQDEGGARAGLGAGRGRRGAGVPPGPGAGRGRVGRGGARAGVSGPRGCPLAAEGGGQRAPAFCSVAVVSGLV